MVYVNQVIQLKPDNLLVDYDLVHTRVANFQFVVGDWGTSGSRPEHFGGTPVYASDVAFNDDSLKDLFAFGQMAFELYFDEAGKLVAHALLS